MDRHRYPLLGPLGEGLAAPGRVDPRGALDVGDGEGEEALGVGLAVEGLAAGPVVGAAVSRPPPAVGLLGDERHDPTPSRLLLLYQWALTLRKVLGPAGRAQDARRREIRSTDGYSRVLNVTKKHVLTWDFAL